jgi:predicted metal-binding protein
MGDVIKLGIIICDRYRTCAGGKCLRALRNREGAFARYKGKDVELVGFATCNGCPGGNVEYVPQEIKNNGAEVSHIFPGLLKKNTVWTLLSERTQSHRNISQPTRSLARGIRQRGKS